MKKCFYLFFAILLVGCPDPEYPNCETDEHCKRDGRDEWCVKGLCQVCTNNSHCQENYLCKDYKCEPECSADTDCESPFVCKSNKCQPECSIDSDCGNEQSCVEQKCEEKPAEDLTQQAAPSCDFQTIYFDFDQSILSTESRDALKANLDCMNQNVDKNFVLEGHCDERGTVEYNIALGERRANATKKYLLKLGADSSKLRVNSLGENAPAVDGSGEDAWSKNRRVETVVSE